MSKSKRSGLRSHWAILKWAGVVLSVAALIAAWFLLPVEDWMESFQRWIEGLGSSLQASSPRSSSQCS